MHFRLLLLLSVLFGFNASGQFLLKNTNLNLNPGGEILDIAYLSGANVYIVVGSFSTINGVGTYNNIAVLNADFTAVIPTNSVFPTFNGRINCVQNFNNDIYVGGNFTTVGGISHEGLVRLNYTPTGFGNYNYTLQPFAPLTDGGVVHDLELVTGTSNRMIAAGEFYTFTSGVEDPSRPCIVAFNPSNGSIYPTMFTEDNGLLNVGERYSGGGITNLSIKKTSTGYALSGACLCTMTNCPGGDDDKLFLVTYDNSGVLTTNNPTPVFQRPTYDGAYLANAMDLVEQGTKLLSAVYSFQTHGLWAFDKATYTAYPFLYRTNNTPDLISSYPIGIDFHDVEMYQNNIYTISGLGNNEVLRKDVANYQLINYMAGNYYTLDNVAKMPITTSNDQGPVSGNARGMKIIGNRLFISAAGLTAVNGTARSRFAVVCLEPEDAKPFVTSGLDTVVCAGNLKKFTVSTSAGANGYRWTYNGPGVKYYIPGTSTYVPNGSETFLPLNGSAPLIDANANIIWLKFDQAYTGGTLKVEPFGFCNGTADTLFSKPKQLTLVSAPLPNLQLAADSLEFNCLVDTLTLSVSSSTPLVTYRWFYNGTQQSTQANHQLPQTVFSNGYVYATVTESSSNPYNGCVKRDSVHISVNTVYPEPAALTNPLVWSCATDSMEVTVSDTNSFAPGPAVINFLENGSYTGSNPFTIYNELTNPSYVIYYPDNGCSDTGTVVLSTNNDLTNAIVSGYPQGTVDLGTLDCSDPDNIYSLEGFPAGSDGENYWIFGNDTIQDNISISVMDSPLQHDTIELNFYSVNPNNGCVSPLQLVAIVINTEPPFVDDFTGQATMTCSEDSLVLNHIPTAIAADQGWLVNNVSNSSANLTVFDEGEFVYRVEGDNGCLSYDTVTVTRTNELLVNGTPDFYVCPGEPFSVSAQALGSGPFSYSWENNLGTGSAGTGGNETEFIVTATNNDGCVGTDTVNVLITDPVEATFIGYSSCGSGGFIQVDSISGGAVTNNSQYTYSFNNGPLTTVNNFPVNQFGDYPFSIFDTMNCEYGFLTSITGQIQQPEMDFLVSTYNTVGDTLILVNTSGFQGFAGYEWSSSGNVEFINTTGLSALVTAADSGWYDLTFTGYLLDSLSNPGEIDTCYYVYSKPVYFGNLEVNYQDSVTDYGISGLVVYPNPNAIGSLQPVNVSFSMGKAQNVYCVVMTQLGAPVPGMTYTGTDETNVSFTLTFPSATAAGNYYLHIITEHDAAQVKLILE